MKNFKILLVIVVVFLSFTLKAQKRDSLTRLNISIYQNYFNNNQYKDAMPAWRWLFINSPKSSKGIYVNGAKMLKNLVDKEKDAKLRQGYLDTLMLIYDRRIEHYGDKGLVLGYKGSDLYRFNPKEYNQVYNILTESVQLQGDKMKRTHIYYYIVSSISVYKDKNIDLDKLVENYETANAIVEANISKGKGASKWEKINDNITTSMAPYLTPEVVKEFYSKKFPEKKKDLKALQKMQKMLIYKNLTSDKLYMDISIAIYDIEPSPEGAYNLGKAFFGLKEYAKSQDFISKAIEQEKDEMKKSEYLMTLAEVYRTQGQFASARTQAQQAAKLNPNDGTPYIFIGDLYARTRCGEDALTRKYVYWVAVDQYQIALSKGHKDAGSRIGTYSSNFPGKEDAFYKNVKAGDVISVGCWIGVTTKARFRN